MDPETFFIFLTCLLTHLTRLFVFTLMPGTFPFARQLFSDEQAVKRETRGKPLFTPSVREDAVLPRLGSASTTAGLPWRRRGFGRTHEPSYEVLEYDKTAFPLVFKSLNSTFRAAYHSGCPVTGLLQCTSNNRSSLSSQTKPKHPS